MRACSLVSIDDMSDCSSNFMSGESLPVVKLGLPKHEEGTGTYNPGNLFQLGID
jgi:hypothetical protein